MRVNFCGVIEGSVVVRPGETALDAIARAETKLNDLLTARAKRFGRVIDDFGPVVGLEPHQ